MGFQQIESANRPATIFIIFQVSTKITTETTSNKISKLPNILHPTMSFVWMLKTFDFDSTESSLVPHAMYQVCLPQTYAVIVVVSD